MEEIPSPLRFHLCVIPFLDFAQTMETMEKERGKDKYEEEEERRKKNDEMDKYR